MPDWLLSGFHLVYTFLNHMKHKPQSLTTGNFTWNSVAHRMWAYVLFPPLEADVT